MEKKKQISEAMKLKLRKAYERVCNSYKSAIERMWDLNPACGYWIADQVGEVYDNGGFVTLNLLEMIYCVEHDISWEEYDEWSQYNIQAHEYGFDFINLKSWHMGCPRVSQEEFDKLRGMRQDIEAAVDEMKEQNK